CFGHSCSFFCASTTFDSRKYDRLERSISQLAKVAGDWNASKYSRFTALTIALAVTKLLISTGLPRRFVKLCLKVRPASFALLCGPFAQDNFVHASVC